MTNHPPDPSTQSDPTPAELHRLFQRWCGETPQQVTPLSAHGSNRRYFRMFGSKQTAIGVYNPDKRENRAFVTFSEHFLKKGLAVPQIYAKDLERNVYLEEDLGDVTLFSLVTDLRAREGFSARLINRYKEVVAALPQFQIHAGRDLDYSVCYPRAYFDQQSMLWDLNYFKYYFLKLAHVPFDEQKLEDDFQELMVFLLETDRGYFLYRDFQSRNVMLHQGKPYFIDYQGGRKGALQYDLASLLFDAKADIPQPVRDRLLEYYLEVAGDFIPLDRDAFRRYYDGYVLLRILQALGAYGFRGFYEGKGHFLASVPYALGNLQWLLANRRLPVKLPALTGVLRWLVETTPQGSLERFRPRLTVRIQSFSYQRGIPYDDRGHGGGFVFDSRLLPNPGRFPEYTRLTGNDPEVIAFLEQKPEVERFLEQVIRLVEQAMTAYQKRNFTDLMVAFGCTGGQHRSVFCANWLARHLQKNYNIAVEVRHRELEPATIKP